MKIAVIGGGINGLCSAWQLAIAGHQVSLFEKGLLMQQTSIASTKLLHGGLRYLEHFEFGLVRESLKERQWWLDNVPGHTRRLPIIYPIYSNSRSRLKIKLGMLLYDFFAGKKGISKHRWLTPRQIKRCSPHLSQTNLKGGYLFTDGQMDDRALGLWVANQCEALGVKIFENTPVENFDTQGNLTRANQQQQFDRIVNAAGPWSVSLLEKSKIQSSHSLDLVRGSHLLLPFVSKFGHLLEVPNEKRIAFVLPFKQQTLLGTTEVSQSIKQPIKCSDEEKKYLLAVFNHYFDLKQSRQNILGEFAGLRPIVNNNDSYDSSASREFKINRVEKLVNVFGGKWTTARALGKAVVDNIN